MRKSQKIIPAILLAASITVSFSASAQNETPLAMKPMSDSAFTVLKESFEYDSTLPLNTRIAGTEKRGNYTREKISINGILNERIPGYIAIPNTGEKPYPCVLMMHGLSVSKEIWWDADNDHSGLLITERLLSKGYAVIMIDARYHGERMIHNDFENPMPLLWNPDTHNRFRRMLTQSTVDCRRALDYLATRSEIDMNRIGVIGYSMGGIQSFQLTALDSRVSAGVSCVGPPRIPNKLLDTFSAYQFAPRITDKPFLVLMGRKDDVLYSVAEAERPESLIASPDSRLILFDSGHHLPSAYVDDAVAWFEQHLGA